MLEKTWRRGGGPFGKDLKEEVKSSSLSATPYSAKMKMRHYSAVTAAESTVISVYGGTKSLVDKTFSRTGLQ